MEIPTMSDRPCSPVTEEPASQEPVVDELPIMAAELIGSVIEGSVECLALFDQDDDAESTYTVEDIDGSLNDDDDFFEEAAEPKEEAVTTDVAPAQEEELVQVQSLMLQSSFCQKATFEEGHASWGDWAPSHDLFGDRPFERYFKNFGHAAVLEADMCVPSLAEMEMDQPCMGPPEEEFPMEGCLTEEFVDFIDTLATDIPANLAASKIQWSFQMMQEWRQIQLQQWEMRALASNRGVRCENQAASTIQNAWREMKIWREVELRLWQQRAMLLNASVRDPAQAAGQIQRAFRRFQARCQARCQKSKDRFATERSFALKEATSWAQVLCPEVDFGASALDSSATAVGAREEEPNPLDAEEIANVWASFCNLFTLATADAAATIQKAWRSHRANKRPTKLIKVQVPPPTCCPITRMLAAMKALQDAAQEEAALCIQKQYRKMRSSTSASQAEQTEKIVHDKPKKTDEEAALCLQEAFRSFRMHKATKKIHARFATEESKAGSTPTVSPFTPLPPSAPKGTSNRRPSMRKQVEASIMPVQPSGKCPQRPSGRKAGLSSTQALSASAISPKAPASGESRAFPRRRPVIPECVQSFQLDDPQTSPTAATGKAITDEFAALGAEIFSVSTPRSKGSKSAASSMQLESPSSSGASMLFSAESSRFDHGVSSPFGKRTPSLNRQSQEPLTPRTPRGTKRAGALLPDLPQVQRPGTANTAKMVEAITRMVR